eukprot:GHVN01105690.1.p1 GENE.GHVN01105690.1~~GHVN01105690.1.p1  ORF type:complete len:176 (-),score=14.35 GHVN01105690.1:2012-2539(-)
MLSDSQEASITSEVNDILSSRQNFVVSNLPVGSASVTEQLLQSILQIIGIAELQIIRFFRIPTRSITRPPLFNVICSSESAAQQVIAQGRKLEGSAMKNVWIQPDLTKSQTSHHSTPIKQRNEQSQHGPNSCRIVGRPGVAKIVLANVGPTDSNHTVTTSDSTALASPLPIPTTS